MMLPFFPYPYPDEWWYSLLARFAKQTGSKSHKMIHEMLFNGVNYNCAKTIPKGSFSILRKLPEGFITDDEIIKNHTVIPLYARFWRTGTYAVCKKICWNVEETTRIKMEQKGPDGRFGARFCPQCYMEDAKKYGEPYWHREHQVPILMVCPKHNCRLRLYERTAYHLSAFLTPLSEIKWNRQPGKETEILDWEKELANNVEKYLSWPSCVGENSRDKPCNLWPAICSKYGAGGFQLNKKALWENIENAIKEVMGVDICQRYFPQGVSADMLLHIKNWNNFGPEKYLLMQCLTHLPADVLFSDESLFDIEAIKRLNELKAEGENKYFASEIAEKMGINTTDLAAFSKQHHIEPFWKFKDWRDYERLRTSQHARTLQNRRKETKNND